MVARIKIGIGAWLGSEPCTAARLGDQAAKAESLGFHSFWLPENHFGEGNSIPAPLLLLAAVSARTNKIRLGTGSYLIPIRHPVQMAEEVAVLDGLSKGRVILGVGRGYQTGMFEVFETSAREKRKDFEAGLKRMFEAWQGKPVGYDVAPKDSKPGVRGEPMYLSPRPVQKPHPPVWVAAFGPKALEQAGRLGLPYLASPVERPEALERNFLLHREACEKAGHPNPEVVPIMRTVFVSRDKRQLSDARKRLGEQAVELSKSAIASIRRSSGNSADDWTIVGEPEEVIEKISYYQERLGITHLIASRARLGSATSAEVEASTELLAEAVAKIGSV